MRRTSLAHATAALLGLALLAGAPPANALFLETPLHLSADPTESDVGQKVRLTVDPANGTAMTEWRDRSIQVVWEVVDPENGAGNGTVVQSLRLDTKAHASFDWTLPEATKDRNIFVVAKSGEDRLGQVHIRVGEAAPMMFLMGGGPADSGVVEGDNGTSPTNGSTQNPPPQPSNRTPGFEGLLALAGLGGVAVFVARRRA